MSITVFDHDNELSINNFNDKNLMDSIKEKCLSSKNNSLENSVVYGYDIKVVRNGYLIKCNNRKQYLF